jgi:hypothetical protein
MKIKYAGIEFIVWKIQSDKLFIKDLNGNKIGYIYSTDEFTVIEELLDKASKL